ncbi:MAG: hypothetical protein M1812_003968 [Candelaria pacifica]|nr:MAG: hypothetical protein M1812_003968 [Candelaria pacifica]
MSFVSYVASYTKGILLPQETVILPHQLIPATTASHILITVTASDYSHTAISQTTVPLSTAVPVSQISDRQSQAVEMTSSSAISSFSSSSSSASVPTTMNTSVIPSATSSTTIPFPNSTSNSRVSTTLSAGARAGLGIGVTLSILILILIGLLALTLRRRNRRSPSDEGMNPKAELEDRSHERMGTWWQKGEKGILVHEIVELDSEEGRVGGKFELEGDTNHRRKTAVELSTSQYRFSRNWF